MDAFSPETQNYLRNRSVLKQNRMFEKPKPKNPKQPIAGLKIKNLASSQVSSLPKLVKKIKKSTTPTKKSQVPPIELPLEYGEVVFPIIVKQKTQA